jgi:hypothetical protein
MANEALEVPGAQPAAARPRRWPLHADDVRGLLRLGVQAVTGATDVVEAMHHTIASRPAPLGSPPAGRTHGLTGLVYGAVRGTTRLVGHGLEWAGALLPDTDAPSTPRREAWRAALNGVQGDLLADSGNPLAIPMQLRIGGLPWRECIGPAPGGRILVLVHGLAMNDLQWSRHGHDHGQALACDAGWTPVYLHYNSGRHVAQNGREFSDRLAELVAGWPVPVQELAIVGHSMGGLVARSACQVGARRAWRRKLSRLVCLGTPHHGAPLERGGRLVDVLLGVSPYAAPLARLGKRRSAGITDLRYGNVRDAEGQEHDRHRQAHDDRRPMPLPRGVEVYFVAATTAASAALQGSLRHRLRQRLLGDGLVPLASALGEHADPALALTVPADHRLVVTQANHWDLLDHPAVDAALRRWLA